MNIRLRFKLIALLIVLSLAGLLVFQGYWLKGLYDTLYKQMEINIEEAMKIADYKELFLRIRSIKKEQGALGPQTQDVYFSSELDPSNKQKMDAKASIHPQKEDPDLNREDIFKTANPDSHMKLHIDYGDEEDFISAELSAVPAFRASDVGFDRSLIGAYGHDDRVCAYASLAAILQLNDPERTAVCMLADKEEIGSEGVTGMKSAAFDTFMEDLCQSQDVPLRACYERSFCLSADVTAAYDPNFAEVYEKRNSALVNCGMGLCKYTGARGKSGASDASAELVAYVRSVLDRADVVWQMAELGKVDAGGGGTVAMFMAERNIDTLDAGVPVLSMHSPFETVGKLDCYMTFKGVKAIYEAK